MFDALIAASLRHRVFVLAAAAALMIAGVLSLQRTPVDVFPALDKPSVTIMTEAHGLAPEEVEALVSMPLEAAVNGMPGVTRVRSVSGIGLSQLVVEFDWGSDLYRNRQLVAERLQVVREQLPANAVAQMGPVASIMGEIALIAIPTETGDTAGAAGSLMAAREWADWVLRPRLLTLPGVAQVIPIGGEVRQFRIAPNPARMQAVGVTLEQLAAVVKDFGGNASGGFLEQQGREFLIRGLGRSARLEDLRRLSVAWKNGVSIPLSQVAEVDFAAAPRRGDAGVDGAPAVIVSVQKQPGADTVALTRALETALAELATQRPSGLAAPRVLFRQADFITAAVGNVAHALRDGAILVAVVLFLFLGNTRTTLISLTAIPLALLAAFLAFRAFGLSINTMTLGGLAIAIGELVDDAVVDVENVLRRLKANAIAASPESTFTVVAAASREVRSGVVYATLVVVLVFVPLFALPGIEGRFFAPLGIAYIVSILASMLVALTVTPVLCAYLLPKLVLDQHPDSRLVRWLKKRDAQLLIWSFPRASALLLLALAAVLAAAASVPFFARSFLPPFNEGTLTVNVVLEPGTSLTESSRIGALAERLLRAVPEVAQTGRRTGRAELDEHAEGVHYTEIDVDLKASERSRTLVVAEIRQRLALLPAGVSVGQPIAHRLDHVLSGVRAQLSIKVFGDDLDALRASAEALRTRLATVPGIADLQVEKQVRIPQLKVRIDHEAAARYGMAPAAVLHALETLSNGTRVSQIIEGNRRFDVVLRLLEPARGAEALSRLLVETPGGRVPLALLASIEEGDGPNQIGREGGKRRIVVSANTQQRDLAAVVADVRREIAATPLPPSAYVVLEGQFQAQEEATRLLGLLAMVAMLMVFVVLHARYRSSRLVLMIMANIPLALVGGVAALWLSGQPLSVAALVGFVTLAGIATRNGILKISHYINLCRFEGERFGADMVVRGSIERLTPVLMTASVAALALLPLLLAADAPGKEILHPVAVVIFGGLVSSTLLDTLLTPLMFLRWGEVPLRALLVVESDDIY
jgi:HME family heavy-metal exporter